MLHLRAPELWPKVALSDADCAELERRLTAVCPALRNEAFLPHWDYAGEHKLPLIPEPLGLVSLSRTERRVDPEASMGCAVLVVLGAVAVLALFVKFPPWVPGSTQRLSDFIRAARSILILMYMLLASGLRASRPRRCR